METFSPFLYHAPFFCFSFYVLRPYAVFLRTATRWAHHGAETNAEHAHKRFGKLILLSEEEVRQL